MDSADILSLETEKRIFGSLEKLGCCLRCCLRFIGCRTSSFYENPLVFAKKSGYIEDYREQSTKETPCLACVGILQDNICEAVTERVRSEVEKRNYDCPTFVCAQTLPISTRIRERSLHVHLAKELDLSPRDSDSLKQKLQSIKDAWKHVVPRRIEQATGKSADLTSSSPFHVEIFLAHPRDESECRALSDRYEESYRKSARKRRRRDEKCSRRCIDALLAEVTDEQFAECFTVPPIKSDCFVTVENVICSHCSVFVGGRYNKFSRKLSQTPWFVNGEKKMESSIQDILCTPIAELFKAQSIKFLSSGREDVDVRNIYSGRPFAVELVNPRVTRVSQVELSRLASKINATTEQVRITSDLQVLTRADLKTLKDGENAKTKFYRALCVCRASDRDRIRLETLNDTRNVKIIQKTPLRVLHRRPLTPRPRFVHEMRARWASPSELKGLERPDRCPDAFFVLDVKTQAGTYVKEFVHGDFGRTRPSLCDLLGAEVDIIALDVTGINLNWP